MSPDKKIQGGDLFIVDNSDTDWKVKQYLRDWTELAHSYDIATGYFDIGALLALDGHWQKLEQIRILMGDTVSKSTKKALLEGISQKLDESIETEKERNDFLSGVPAIVQAIASKQILCKIYTKAKFHAKAYITHAKQSVIGSSALVGSSNFTLPGLTTNIELNIQIRREVEALQAWYEHYWDEAEEISEDILTVIERHTKEYSPFEVYAKALQEYFKGHEITAGEWELTKSQVYPRLDRYQKEGYQAMMKIGGQYSGAFLCDGVGLGKTLIGLMLIERAIFNKKNVALIVPKAARKPVWEKHLKRYLPKLGVFYSGLAILNHTDFLTQGADEKVEEITERADIIVIDEAHHFRNPGTAGKTRYWKLYDLCKGKTVFMLTATPVNNSLRDLQHMLELFTQKDTAFFKSIGINSLPGHFTQLEKALENVITNNEKGDADSLAATNQVDAQKVLFNDQLFRDVVVQRSRAYVKKSQEQHGGTKVIFPKREPPQVVDYSIKKTYGKLLDAVEAAFNRQKPLFSLAMYYPILYLKQRPTSVTEEFAFRENRQKQLVGLIRILFLKRFESSARAFELSCQELLIKMLLFITKYSSDDLEIERLANWKNSHKELIRYVQEKRNEIYGKKDEEEGDEDIVTADMLKDYDTLTGEGYKPADFKVEEIISETYGDLEQIAAFLTELKKFKPANDDKLRNLIGLLQADPVLREHKVLIFTEYLATARYLKTELIKAAIKGVDEVDSFDDRDRGDVILQFAPYYNYFSSGQLLQDKKSEIRILISTDVLSEGLNLQDATRLINYDLHWNPVRLMQRIGRVDRRLDPLIEENIIHDHPEQKDIRGTTAYWNFLPPDELERLLKLYEKVTHKTLRISKVFGIEGKKLLTPNDDFDALKDFNHAYEGEPTELETLHLEYQKLLQEYPELDERLKSLPGRVFSGKQHPHPDSKAVFFCYSLPVAQITTAGNKSQSSIAVDAETWNTRWYIYDLGTEKIKEEPGAIADLIRSKHDTPRHRTLPEATLVELRRKMEKYIDNTYMKRVDAPMDIRPLLKAWMELS